MPDIVMACSIDADAGTVFRAISTSEGVQGWFTANADIGEGVGAVHRLTFPELPAPWELRVDEEETPSRLRLSVLVGPPQWEGTSMTYEVVERPDGGVTLKFRSRGFRKRRRRTRLDDRLGDEDARSQEVRRDGEARSVLRFVTRRLATARKRAVCR